MSISRGAIIGAVVIPIAAYMQAASNGHYESGVEIATQVVLGGAIGIGVEKFIAWRKRRS